jgi:Holliday junction resolvasome RuvABC endonuclease subunit
MGRTKAVIGIDPGQTGAACLLKLQKHVPVASLRKKKAITPLRYPEIAFHDFTDMMAADVFLKATTAVFDVQFVVLERQWLRGNEKNLKTAEVLIRNAEMWSVLLALNGIPFFPYAPATWRKGLITGKASKKKSMDKALALFPNSAELLTRHDRAEAALMAYRAYMHVLNGGRTEL